MRKIDISKLNPFIKIKAVEDIEELKERIRELSFEIEFLEDHIDYFNATDASNALIRLDSMRNELQRLKEKE